MIRHLAFFEVLAELDEDTPRWAAVSAGLLVMRAFDRWVEDGHVALQATVELAAVQRVVSQMQNGPARALLDGILQEIRLGKRTPQAVLPRLLAYARSLHFDGELTLASDVTSRVVELARHYSNDDVNDDLTLGALQQLGLTLRVQGELDLAESTYTELERRSNAAGDVARVLRSRIGLAKLMLARGNLPMAERMLDEVVADAHEHGLSMVAGVALHDRAAVAHARGDHASAVRLLFDALRVTEDSTSRDGVLGDLAANLMSLGAFAPARDALVVLALTAQEGFRRQLAEINLMELATLERNELSFEQRRQILATQSLPPEYGAHYHLYAARGLLSFGRNSALVREELTRARRIATEHNFHQLQFKIDEVETALERGEREAAVGFEPTPDFSAQLDDVAETLSGLRELAEAGT